MRWSFPAPLTYSVREMVYNVRLIPTWRTHAMNHSAAAAATRPYLVPKRTPSCEPLKARLNYSDSPTNCAISPTASLGDKLQVLAMRRPTVLRVLEKIVDGLLAKEEPA